MKGNKSNSSVVVWVVCILLIISAFEILWSLSLFFGVSDMLFLTSTDLVNAVVLLSGLLMLPNNFYMVHQIARGNRIDYKARVGCCRLWTCIVWVITVNVIGVILCIQRIYLCQEITWHHVSRSIKLYRTVPKHRNFIDKLQWSLKCCGLKSYKDWFSQDWQDKARDYEWTVTNLKNSNPIKGTTEMDSVPFSCCKSGSCVSSFLKELGNYSINTKGCGNLLYRIVILSLSTHLILFVTVIVLEILLLRHITVKKNEMFQSKCFRNKFNIRHIMSVNNNFEVTSDSYNLSEEDSDIEAPKDCCDDK